MTNMLHKIAGMSGMTDQVIATDFLINSKSAVRNLAFALTESVTPEARILLRQQLNDAVQTHKLISQYMMDKGYYFPKDYDEQLKVELKASKAALKLAK